MQYIHNYLCAHHPWYDEWHKEVHANAVSWSVFLLFTILSAQVMVEAVQGAMPDSMTVAQSASLIEAVEVTEPVPPPAPLTGADAIMVLNTMVTEKLDAYTETLVRLQEEQLTPLRQTLTERQALLIETVATDVPGVRTLVMDHELWSRLPADAVYLTEQPFLMEGTYLDPTVIEGASMSYPTGGPTAYLEVSDGARYQIAITHDEAGVLLPGSSVKVQGVMLVNGLVVPQTIEVIADVE